MEYQDSDYELIYLINENNEEAKEIFFNRYKELVEIKAKKYYPYVNSHGVELNDLVQEGMIGLSNAINGFRNEKNTLFSTYANKCIEMHLLSFVRLATNGRNFILNSSVSLDDKITPTGTPLKHFIKDVKNVNPEELVINNETNAEIKNISLNKFTALEKQVFDLRTKGLSYKEISTKLNITKKSAEHAMSRAKKKIEKIK